MRHPDARGLLDRAPPSDVNTECVVTDTAGANPTDERA
jgi:hypothetical protein